MDSIDAGRERQKELRVRGDFVRFRQKMNAMSGDAAEQLFDNTANAKRTKTFGNWQSLMSTKAKSLASSVCQQDF